MNNKFDELTKQMAQSVTRRAALKKFGLGLAGMALAAFGLANKARATTYQGFCQITTLGTVRPHFTGLCMDINSCVSASSPDCPAFGTGAGASSKATGGPLRNACGYEYKSGNKCSFNA